MTEDKRVITLLGGNVNSILGLIHADMNCSYSIFYWYKKEIIFIIIGHIL
jgi:hypothetical protein